MLPDNVLVEIFLYVNILSIFDWDWDRVRDWDWGWSSVENPWLALVHVCRRWRYLVLASPRRLNLRLEYGGHGPMSEVLDGWPVLPIVLKDTRRESDQRWDNVVAALESEHYNRICGIQILYMT